MEYGKGYEDESYGRSLSWLYADRTPCGHRHPSGAAPARAEPGEGEMRTACISNLRQCGIALSMWAEDYKRYPHQRKPLMGRPFGDDQPVWTLPGLYVAHEWEEVVRLGSRPGTRSVSRRPMWRTCAGQSFAVGENRLCLPASVGLSVIPGNWPTPVGWRL